MIFMKKTLFLLPLALLLASCSNDPSSNHPKDAKGDRAYGGTLRYNETEPLQTLFPLEITDAISSHIASQVYEGLVKFNPGSLEVIPALASKWDIDASRTVYTFHIRSNAYFHDNDCFPEGKGRKVTAKDFEYAFRMLCSGENTSLNFATTFKDRLKGANKFNKEGGTLEGVKVLSDSVLQLTLEKPSNSFIYVLANPAACVLAKEAVEKHGNKVHVGTGPFMVQEIKSDTSGVVLVRNNNYYGMDKFGNQLPFLDTIKVSFIDSKKAELEAFEAGKLDFVWGMNKESIISLVENNINLFKNPAKYELERNAEMVTQLYEFNTTREPFNNVKVRQAFCYAINRNKIIEGVLRGEAYGPGINGISPPALKDYNTTEIKGYDFDPEMARKLLSEAGYKTPNNPKGKDFPNVRLVLNSGGAKNTNVASEIQNQLRDVLGVNMDFVNVTFQQKLDDARYARSDIFRSAWVADFPSAENFLSLYYGAEVPDSTSKPSFPNTSRYKNPEYDKLFEAGKTAATIEEANKLFLQAEQLMMKDAPSMILWYDDNFRLKQANVQNLKNNAMRYYDFSEVFIKKKADPKTGGDSAKSGGEEKK